MNYVLSLGKEVIEKRKLIWDLGKADFRKRFVGSYFGIVWMFIQPIVTVAIYGFIFGENGFKTPPPVPGVSYVAWLVPGIVPWFFFSECLNTMTGSLQEYSYLVKKVVFKVEILPMIKLVSCLLVHGFFVLIMIGLYLLTGVQVRITWIQAIYYTFAASVLVLGIGFFTCAVNVFFKDMTQIVGICLQFGIWMTPIMYDATTMFGDRHWIMTLLKLNPFYYIAAGYRDSMLTGSWFWERPLMTVYYWTFTIIVFLVGLKMFKRLRPHFSDVL